MPRTTTSTSGSSGCTSARTSGTGVGDKRSKKQREHDEQEGEDTRAKQARKEAKKRRREEKKRRKEEAAGVEQDDDDAEKRNLRAQVRSLQKFRTAALRGEAVVAPPAPKRRHETPPNIDKVKKSLIRELIGLEGEEGRSRWLSILAVVREELIAGRLDPKLKLTRQAPKLALIYGAIEERVPELDDTFVASWGTEVLVKRSYRSRKGYAAKKGDPDSCYGRRTARKRGRKAQESDVDEDDEDAEDEGGDGDGHVNSRAAVSGPPAKRRKVVVEEEDEQEGEEARTDDDDLPIVH